MWTVAWLLTRVRIHLDFNGQMCSIQELLVQEMMTGGLPVKCKQQQGLNTVSHKSKIVEKVL
jgi:hypothetical protein